MLVPRSFREGEKALRQLELKKITIEDKIGDDIGIEAEELAERIRTGIYGNLNEETPVEIIPTPDNTYSVADIIEITS